MNRSHLIIALVSLLVAACGSTTDKRIGGAAVGAGTGALVAGPVGAVVGGAVGAISGPAVANGARSVMKD
ncbi:MAG: hypothetical protein ACRCYS_04285 [Beijerinckiaceae bacterium]